MIAKYIQAWLVGVVFFLSFMVCVLPAAFGERPEDGFQAGIDKCIEEYIAKKSFIAALGAIIIFICLTAFKLDLAFVISFLSFFFSFLPEFGFIFQGLFVLLVVVLKPDMNFITRICALGVPLLLSFGVGQLEKIAFADDIHPIIVLLSLAFWQKIWDIPGMMLAVPITAILKIVLERLHHPYARVLSNLLGGKLSSSSDSEEEQKRNTNRI